MSSSLKKKLAKLHKFCALPVALINAQKFSPLTNKSFLRASPSKLAQHLYHVPSSFCFQNSVVQSDYRIQSPAGGSPLPLCAAANATSNNANSSGDSNSSAVGILQNNTSAVNAAGNNTNSAGGPNTVLRVIVESLMYPVSLDILHQIFQRYGKVLKIVTFTKNNSFQVNFSLRVRSFLFLMGKPLAFQALIQYPDANSAQHAKSLLDGQNIYNGCCTLRIDNSKLTALNVKYNNDKSRDFTNPALPPGEPGVDLMPTAGGLMNTNDLLLIAARQRPSLTGDKIGNTDGTFSRFFLYVFPTLLVANHTNAIQFHTCQPVKPNF